MSENDPYRRDQYKRTRKDALVTMLLSTQDREKASDEERKRLLSQRTLDESKIHQLQTALDGAVRARTQALEGLHLAQKRMYSNSTIDSNNAALNEQVRDLRRALAILDRVIK